MAIDARTGRRKWRYEGRRGRVRAADRRDTSSTSAAWDRRVYALNVRQEAAPLSGATGRRQGRRRAGVRERSRVRRHERWPCLRPQRSDRPSSAGARNRSRASAGREYFYATPAVAYGRVFLGNTDGTVYAYGASTGHLLWARQAGTYVYSAPAVWRKLVFVGTWDGYFSALDVRTGDFRWRYKAPGGIMGASTVLDGLVYFSTFGRFSQRHLQARRERAAGNLRAQRAQRGPRSGDSTMATTLRSSPTRDGSTSRERAELYALIPKARLKQVRHWQALAKCERLRRARARARCLSKARRGTTSGKRGSGKARRTSKPQNPAPPPS